jgi:hypothetical protein
MTNHKDESTEHRVLAALREINPQKRAEVVAVIEAMAAAFPKPAKVSLARPALLSLVVSDGRIVGAGERSRHHQERVLPALSHPAVLTK